MDEQRKRVFTSGLILGAVTVGVTVLFARTPRDQWGSALSRVAKDVLGLAKTRYGMHPAIVAAEKSLEHFQGAGKAG